MKQQQQQQQLKREKWSSKREYLLSCIGYAVGLGNIWRFPYLCFESGGGAFLVPYFFMLVFCGVPLLYLELAVGASTGLGPVHAIGALCPLLKGVGVATVVISFILCTYYNVIITWAIYYLVNSLRAELPWYGCEAQWSSPNCTVAVNRSTENATAATWGGVSPIQDFFDRKLLARSDGIEHMGTVKLDLLACFVAAWLLCYLAIFNGIKSTGKVVHFTVIFPYLILAALLAASSQLPGAVDGLLYFVRPRWAEIADMKIWVYAAAQNFNSIGIAFGPIIAFASYSPNNDHLLRDTLTIATVNCLTSLLAGVVVFSAMGHTAHLQGVTVDKVVREGPELVFILYPQIFSNLPCPPAWSAMFFLMLIALGIDSQFGNVEVVVTTLSDAFGGRLVSRYFRGSRRLLCAAVCTVAALCGLPSLFNGGIYVFTLLDKYTAIVALMFIAFGEVVALCWLYGADRVSEDIRRVSGHPAGIFFRFCWWAVVPVLIGVILVFTVVEFKPASYGAYAYPWWGRLIGWLVTATSLACIPVYAGVALANANGDSVWQRLRSSVTPEVAAVAAEAVATHDTGGAEGGKMDYGDDML